MGFGVFVSQNATLDPKERRNLLRKMGTVYRAVSLNLWTSYSDNGMIRGVWLLRLEREWAFDRAQIPLTSILFPKGRGRRSVFAEATARQNGANSLLRVRFRRRSLRYGGQVEGQAKGAPIRFCETNPFYFPSIVDVLFLFTKSYAVRSQLCKWVRFRKRTHFGGYFWGIVCREN